MEIFQWRGIDEIQILMRKQDFRKRIKQDSNKSKRGGREGGLWFYAFSAVLTSKDLCSAEFAIRFCSFEQLPRLK